MAVKTLPFLLPRLLSWGPAGSAARVLLVGALALVLTLGCAKRGIQRVGLSGVVTFHGQPLEGGTIQFRAPSGSGGEAAAAVVSNGRYDIPASHGVLPGTYEVVISAPAGAAPAVGLGFGLAKERLPAKVNTATTLRVEVKAEGPNRFDFPID